MPSRQLSPTVSSPPFHHINHHHRRLVPPLAASMAAAAFSILLLFFTLCFRRQRTVPSSNTTSKPLRPLLKPLNRFSYSSLRRATSSFSPSLRLGQGGFGSVFRGTLKPDLNIAVKLMDSGSLQGEREFQNELYFGGKIDSEHVVSVIGFCSDPKRRRMVLVYELLANGSLQDCLLHRKCFELMDWNIRFLIALNIAKGLEYLHHFCDPPIIHGDIKPSNILLDDNYCAKIGDFGLAKMKSLEIRSEIRVKNEGNDVAIEENRFEKATNERNLGNEIAIGDNRVEIEEEEITVSGGGVSPESCFVRVEETPESMADGVDFSPETETVVSPRIVAAMASPIEMFGMSISADSFHNSKSKEKQRKTWSWKKYNGEIRRNDVEEKPKSRWIRTLSINRIAGKNDSVKKKMIGRKLNWWVSLDDDKNVRRRAAREWWKEEYTDELSRKKKKEQETVSDDVGYIDTEKWYSEPKIKNRSRKSWSGSMDWWSDGLSGDLRKTRGTTSYDSGGFSSTPSLRGTVCYIAPEYRIRGDLSEKCDVYSYGVLLLVLVTGRRPLEFTGSPLDDFKRANLVSWARDLARGGRVLDLVDQKMHSLDQEQALLCINVALLCLQKSPSNRPSMQEIVGILSGELDSPELPPEYSHARHNKSRKKL